MIRYRDSMWSVLRTNFLIHLTRMRLDGVMREEHLLGDLFVSETPREATQNMKILRRNGLANRAGTANPWSNVRYHDRPFNSVLRMRVPWIFTRQ